MALSTWLGNPRPKRTGILVGIAPNGSLWTATNPPHTQLCRVRLRDLWHSLGRRDLVVAARETLDAKRRRTPLWLRREVEAAHAELEALDSPY